MALNFNVDPYYDDFDPTKDFHRVLFKPGFAVQARELTQSQTILQNQISNFADHIFSQNSPVSGGRVTVNLDSFFIKLNLQDPSGADVVASNFLNKEIQDADGIIRARVIATAEATTSDPPTLVVNYYSGLTFTGATTIFCSDGSNFTATTIGTLGSTICTGKSSVASISQGVFYVVNGYSTSSTANPDGTFSKYSIGNFVQVSPQTVILSKYSNVPSNRVGLLIDESVVDYVDDASLLDPAVGASNYQAPGADRYKISLELTSLPLELGNDDQFIELVRIVNGQIVRQVDGSVYSVIDDYFAKREFESNGDYIVNDFKLTPSANTVDSSKYNLNIGKGLAYVRGYRIENQFDFELTEDRSRTTESIDNNAVYIDYGSYFIVTSANGTFDVTTMPQIDLHCVANGSVLTTNTTTYNSTLVGKARIRNLEFVSSTSDADTKSYIYRAYVCDANTTTLTGLANTGTATTITFEDTDGSFSSTANAYLSVPITIVSGTSVGDARRIVSYDGTTKTATVDAPFTVTPDNTTQFVLNFSTTQVESLVYANNLIKTVSADIDETGKVNGVVTGDTILENAGTPELLFEVGYPYTANISNSDYTSTRVFRSKTFTSVGGNYTLTITIGAGIPMTFLGTGTLSSGTIKQNFTVINKTTGRILDFCSAGQTVTLSGDKKTVTFTSNTYVNPTVDVIAAVNISNADNVTNVLKTKNLVTGNTTVASISGPDGTIGNAKIDLTKGQVYILNAGVSENISLYVSDVKKIRKIINTKSAGTAAADFMLSDSTYDITSLFQLDNGQRDNLYDHASIQLVAGASVPKGNILVIFDYYAHTGGDGYFNVNSYLAPNSSSPESYAEIPVYTSRKGKQYRLTDSIDFRPVRLNAQSKFEFDYTGNPSVDDTGILIPQNLSEYVSDYSYYLGRKDKLVLTKDREFKIIKGTPAVNPIFPTEPDGSLVLANMSYDPFTAYVPGEAPSGVIPNLSIEKVLHKNWIKKDITDLQSRVNNLEYYSALSLLESSAQSLQIPDTNGLNRFKNGILVDDFSSYATADTANPDYLAKIDSVKKRMTALTLVENFQLQNPIVLSSLGTLRQFNNIAVASINGTYTNIYTLPYTTANVAVQPLSSSTISINPFNVVQYEGIARISPPMDNWVDDVSAPSLVVSNPQTQVFQQTGGVNVLNSGNYQTVPGTVYTTSSSTSTTTAISGGTSTTTTTINNTYADQTKTITSGGYTPITSTVNVNNGYLTNIAVLPYIRSQQLIFRAKGLLVNAPVQTWFDGVSIDQYISSPNTIELTNVQGAFKEDDIVGFYYSSKFNPVGRVVSIYKYPESSNARLYMANLLGAPAYVPVTLLQNATFNSSGTYVSSSANGVVNFDASSLQTSGVITGVGGSYSNTAISGLQLYRTQSSTGWGTFLNQYGIWGDTKVNSPTYNAAFAFLPTEAGNHTITYSSTGATTVRANGSVISSGAANPTTTTSVTYNVATLGTTTLSWNITGSPAPQGFALTVTSPTGQIIFRTTNPPSVVYDSVAQEVLMPGGGSWFTGVTKVKLDSKASNVANYYVGTKINIFSEYVFSYTTETATYVPPPPAPRRRGSCFTEDSLVLLADGKTKKISEVQVGEKVYNWNKTEINTVTFIEKTLDTKLGSLYSIKKKEKPFATINHPIYIDGELSSPIPDEIYEAYPWLGKTKQIEAANIIPAQGNIVYNLWVDGDSTYQVNGYGTTSIIGEGGVLRKVTERCYMTPERASELLFKFTDNGKDVAYGAYLLNNYFGKLDNKIVNSILVKAFKDEESKITQKVVMTLFKVVGKIACIVHSK